MKILLPFFILMLLLTGCNPGTVPGMTPASTMQAPIITSSPGVETLVFFTVTVEPVSSPSADSKAQTPEEAPSEMVSSSPTPTLPADMPVLTQTDGSLTVEIFSNPEVEVDVPEFWVSGRAPTDTVISINDEIILIEENQEFSVRISLDEGPNIIEVVASDSLEQEVSFLLTVFYNPPS
jgi:hypothetical protein